MTYPTAQQVKARRRAERDAMDRSANPITPRACRCERPIRQPEGHGEWSCFRCGFRLEKR